jgi:hypothetical protein
MDLYPVTEDGRNLAESIISTARNTVIHLHPAILLFLRGISWIKPLK